METSRDIRDIRDDLLEQFREENDLIVGNELTVDCDTTMVIAEYGNEKVYGCGLLLAKFVIWEDFDAIWEIVTDMYMIHLHNKHGLDSPI